MSASRFIANPDLRNNGRRKLLFLGETGVGKSALCNALSQPVQTNRTCVGHDFPKCDDTSIENRGTILKNVKFLGMRGRELSLIDTVGFNGTEMDVKFLGMRGRELSLIDTVGFNSTEMDNTAIAELIVSLKENCDFIHLFAIVVSAPGRVEASLIETIKIFVGMFGKERFWQNAVLIFTNLQQSDDQIISRHSKFTSDEKLMRDFKATMNQKFKLRIDIPTLIIDAHYDGSKQDERNRFSSSAQNLFTLLNRSAGVSVSNFERVTGRYEGLKEEIDRERKEKEDQARKGAEKEKREAEKMKREVAECPDFRISENGRKKLLLLGVTGSGKSALCNALSQHIRRDDRPLNQLFPESANQRIGNTETILKNVNFLGNGHGISLIDTVGFNSTEMNNTAIAELIVSLKDSCDYINLFAIVVSAPKRVEASLKETIELFVGMFGSEGFWQNAVLILTNIQQSDDLISRRSKVTSDEKLMRDFKATMKQKFKIRIDVPTLIIDAHYDGSKQDERDRFSSSAQNLLTLLNRSAGVCVGNVEKVTGRYEGLQEEVVRERTAKEEARREANDLQVQAMQELIKDVALGVGGVAIAVGGTALAFLTRNPRVATASITAAAAIFTSIAVDNCSQ